MIKTVTITGADDTIKPQDIIRLSAEFPFVEWGILISRGQRGVQRFPTFDWLAALSDDPPNKLSLHLCGAYVREALLGNATFIKELGTLWPMFKRVQINTHGLEHPFNEIGLGEIISANQDKEFIFQYDNVNTRIINAMQRRGLTVAVLFDLSHGEGVLPNAWPFPIDGVHCGYAGGLSPGNLEEQIKKIQLTATGTSRVWIDMETHVRSKQGRIFDLDKVKQCLTISSKYITNGISRNPSWENVL